MDNQIIAHKVAIACDHAGTELKHKIISTLQNMNIEIIDFGTNDTKSVDYPDYAHKVAKAIVNKSVDMGVLICGTGIGMDITANKYPEIRCGLCHNDLTAQATRQHNNANIIALGARVIDEDTALSCVKIFFTTKFENGRHQQRINKINN